MPCYVAIQLRGYVTLLRRKWSNQPHMTSPGSELLSQYLAIGFEPAQILGKFKEVYPELNYQLIFNELSSRIPPSIYHTLLETYYTIVIRNYVQTNQIANAISFLKNENLKELVKELSYILVLKNDDLVNLIDEDQFHLDLAYFSLLKTNNPLAELKTQLNNAYMVKLTSVKDPVKQIDVEAFLNVYYFMCTNFESPAQFLNCLAEKPRLLNEFKLTSVKHRFHELIITMFKQDPLKVAEFLREHSVITRNLLQIIDRNIFGTKNVDSEFQRPGEIAAREMSLILNSGVKMKPLGTPMESKLIPDKAQKVVVCGSAVDIVKLSPCGNYLAISAKDKLSILSKDLDWSSKSTFFGMLYFVYHMEWSRDSSKLLLNLYGHKIGYYDMLTGNLVIQDNNLEDMRLAGVCWHPEIRNLCYVGYTRSGCLVFKRLDEQRCSFSPAEELLTINSGIQTFAFGGSNYLYILSAKYLGCKQLLYKLKLSNDGEDVVKKEVFLLPSMTSNSEEIYANMAVSTADPHLVFLVTVKSDVLVFDYTGFKKIRQLGESNRGQLLTSVCPISMYDTFLVVSNQISSEPGAFVLNRFTNENVTALRGHSKPVTTVSAVTTAENKIIIATGSLDKRVNIYF